MWVIHMTMIKEFIKVADEVMSANNRCKHEGKELVSVDVIAEKDKFKELKYECKLTKENKKNNLTALPISA